MAKSIVISVRCDAKSVAELARYFELKGRLPNTIGRLARLGLESLAVLCKQQYPEIHCAMAEEALEELEKRGLYKAANVRDAVQELASGLDVANLPEMPEAKPTVSDAFQARLKESGLSVDEIAERLEKRLGEEDDSGDFSIEEMIKFKPETVEEEEDSTDNQKED